jgi:hypothetical protein
MKPQCRACGSADFVLVGGFVVSNSGVTYKPPMQLNSLTEADYVLTRELLECRACGKKSLLTDCVHGDAVPKVRWETTDRNTRRPVVCPKCSNRTHFVRRTIRSFNVSEYVQISEAEIVSVETGESTQLEEILVKYECGIDGCDGAVEISDPDYYLVRR